MEEDDSERSMLLEKISDLLLSGGYFRAQISNLSPFDKLTGGLAWSITASNVDVDFDVLYDDDATLGYKMWAPITHPPNLSQTLTPLLLSKNAVEMIECQLFSWIPNFS